MKSGAFERQTLQTRLAGGTVASGAMALLAVARVPLTLQELVGDVLEKKASSC